MLAAATADKPSGDTWLGILQQTALLLFLPMVIAALDFPLMNWRCPACSACLGRQISIRHCPQCGAQLAGK
jgi:rubrerythrin